MNCRNNQNRNLKIKDFLNEIILYRYIRETSSFDIASTDWIKGINKTTYRN